MSNRPSGVVLLGISGLFIVLLDYNINGKVVTRIFITNVTGINKELMVEFFIFDYNCILK